MSTDDVTPLVLTREDLYQLVWSKPMSELAIDFGISDVALAKRCKKLGIPRPGRGYWARFDAGQRPHQPKLPKREEKWQDTQALRVAPIYTAPLSRLTGSEEEPEAAAEDAMEVPKRIEALVIEPTRSVLMALNAVRRTAVHLRHPQRADLKFERGTRAGAMLPVSVSPEALDRALCLADTLLRAADTLGWGVDDKAADATVEAGESPPRRSKQPPPAPTSSPREATLLVEDESIGFCIEERFRDEPRDPTPSELAREKREWGYRAPRRVAVPTGHLRVVRVDNQRSWGPERRSWYDRKGTRVESQIKQILSGFHELAQLIKQRRAKAELEAQEHERREVIRRAREARQAAHARLIKQLETDAGAWHRARYLRHYVRVARSYLGNQAPHATFLDQSVDFLNWADNYIDQLDPLSKTPRDEEYAADIGGYSYGDLDRIKQSLTRLTGAEWRHAWKRDRPDKAPANPTDLWRFSERSVFQITSNDANSAAANESDHCDP